MNNKKPTYAALIVAAGKGERFGGTLPKQYQPLLGAPVLAWSVEAFKQHPQISSVHVVIHPEHAALYAAAGDLPQPIHGGASRQESVRKGLEALIAENPDYVLIHDAARPCLSFELISSLCAAVSETTAAIPGLPVTDSVKRQQGAKLSAESREGLYTVQTPQVFPFKPILDLHKKHADKNMTDDAALCEDSAITAKVVPGQKSNIKITEEGDLSDAEQQLAFARSDIRTGKGYDVHRLVTPTHDFHKLVIGGIEIAHDKALLGHSDADVVLHAITDALLGTISDGDIGMHFSPKDARWKNADSAKFLRHAANLVLAQGGLITHIDATVICEEPKIGPHRDRMRARIAEILSLPINRVSVKATTTEGLGFTGRGEGIAAEAVCTVRLPFASSSALSAETSRKRSIS